MGTVYIYLSVLIILTGIDKQKNCVVLIFDVVHILACTCVNISFYKISCRCFNNRLMNVVLNMKSLLIH